MKKLLLFSKDKGLLQYLESGLDKSQYKIELFEALSEAADHIRQKLSDIALIDADGQELSPDEIFRSFKSLAPRLKAIVLSSTKDVSQAVSSIKAGVFDFLAKPVSLESLRTAVDSAFISRLPKNRAGLFSEELWLKGSGQSITDFTCLMAEAAQTEKDAAILFPKGAPAVRAAGLLHSAGFNKNRRLVIMDLADYSRQDSEAAFWTALKDHFAQKESSKEEGGEDLAGTVFLNNFDRTSDHFRKLLLDHLIGRREQRCDRSVKAVLGARSLSEEEKEKVSKVFDVICIPPLMERKEDLPVLVQAYADNFAQKYGKTVKGFSKEALSFLLDHDWSGNYSEMEALIENAVLLCRGEFIEYGDLMADLQMLTGICAKRALLSGRWELSKARELFDRSLIETLILGCENDLDRTAALLDLPKTVLLEKMKGLGMKDRA